MDPRRLPDFDHHEIVEVEENGAHGLKAVVAVHSTALGPASGGCRMWTYPRFEDAVGDALRLSRAMSFKNAVAHLPLGGGKAVIMGDPRTDKTPDLFRAFGDLVERLDGRYTTAEDVGITPQDLAYVRERTAHVAGLQGDAAASGDPSPVTARGVFNGVKLCVNRRMGRSDLDGVRVAIQGVGHVGMMLARLLAEAGARLWVTDIDQAAVKFAQKEFGAKPVALDAIYDADVDVFAPCALGGAVNKDTIARLKAVIVAGAANNQLDDPENDARRLAERKILYAPDFVINGGGIINVAAEIEARRTGGAYDPEWVAEKLARLETTLAHILDEAAESKLHTRDVAIALAKRRIAEASA